MILHMHTHKLKQTHVLDDTLKPALGENIFSIPCIKKDTNSVPNKDRISVVMTIENESTYLLCFNLLLAMKRGKTKPIVGFAQVCLPRIYQILPSSDAAINSLLQFLSR